ncbi:MAG TPA: hypothetical protein VNZ85_17775 [Caulobacter sp.]|nr:hypothetical protein [Caulobacter sp.]
MLRRASSQASTSSKLQTTKKRTCFAVAELTCPLANGALRESADVADGGGSGPIGDWRASVGGFWREDDGIRDPGFTPNKGYQVRASIGRDFERGSFDFNIKHLDDNVILFAGVLKFDAAGEPSAAPGFDPLTGTLAGPETSN